MISQRADRLMIDSLTCRIVSVSSRIEARTAAEAGVAGVAGASDAAAGAAGVAGVAGASDLVP